MSKKSFHIKAVTISIIALFILASCSQIIGGYSEKTNQIDTDIENVYEPKENVLVTCRTFGFPGEPSQEKTMSLSEAEFLYDKIKDIQLENARDPLSDKTQQLQNEIIEIASNYNLLPDGLSPQTIKSRLHPIWIPQSHRKGIPSPLQSKASEFLCTFISTGSGASLPIIVLPRFIPILLTPLPRIFMLWRAQDAMTSCGGLRSGTGFIAYGQQNGLALGFWGLGFTFSLPPLMGVYGLAGYALFATVDAEEIEFFPPNNLPVISNENPPDGAYDISVSLSELSFRLTDADGDLMSYEVTTDPDIGSGSGILKPNGLYTVPISGLEIDKIYRWTIEVNDGRGSIEKEFYFITETLPFDPFNEGWQYRKQITIDHTKVNGDLTSFPVLVSTTDTDLRDKAQNDGDDILFMTGPGVATKLYHEIERYDDSSGELIAWVNLPSISSDEDAVFYMYYGNPSCSSQQFPERVWDSNYKAVWHMNDAAGSTLTDSIGSYDGTKINTPNFQQEGKIGYAVDFDLVDTDAFSFSDVGIFTGSVDFTCELWFYTADSDSNQYFLLFYGEGVASTYLSATDDTAVFYHKDTSEVKHRVYSNDPYPIGTWTYLTATFDADGGATGKEIFFNGSTQGTGEVTTFKPVNLLNAIGAYSSDGLSWNQGMNGSIDEIRISNNLRSDNWISTSYNTMNEPSNFLSFGPEEPGS